MSGMDNIKSSNEKYVLLKFRFDYCHCCLLGEYSECGNLIELDGSWFCDMHGKYLKPMRLPI